MTEPLRVGTAERTAAVAALDEHLAAGRLGVEEYGDRSAAAANATMASELSALFSDLPGPHPPLPHASPPPTAPPPTAPPPTAPLPAVPSTGPLPGAGLLDVWGTRIVAVAPFVALLLFLLTRQWLWFLLVPVVGAVVYAGRGRGGGAPRDRPGRRARR